MILERHGLLIALILAFAVRLPLLVYELPNSPDQIEIVNIADNINRGNGFQLDVKSHFMMPVAVSHNAMIDQSPLMPLVLSFVQGFIPDAAAETITPLLLFLAALALIHLAVRTWIGPSLAAGVVLLLAVHPALLRLSLAHSAYLAELFALAVVLYALSTARRPLLHGLALSLLALAHPRGLLVAAIFLLAAGARAFRQREARPLIGLALGLTFAPGAMIAINALMHAPLFILPGAHRLTIANAGDFSRYFLNRELYASPLDLAFGNGRELLAAQLQILTDFGRWLIDPRGLLIPLLLLPLALAGLRHAKPVMRRCLWIALSCALLPLLTWTRPFEPAAATPLLVLLTIGVLAGLYEILDRKTLSPRSHWSAAMLLVAAIASIWTALDLAHGWHARANAGFGLRFTHDQDVWLTPDVPVISNIYDLLHEDRPDLPPQAYTTATNQPWMLHGITGSPAVMLPYDLQAESYIDLLTQSGANIVVIHKNTWPPASRYFYRQLTTALATELWLPAYIGDDIEIFITSSFKQTVRTAQIEHRSAGRGEHSRPSDWLTDNQNGML